MELVATVDTGSLHVLPTLDVLFLPRLDVSNWEEDYDEWVLSVFKMSGTRQPINQPSAPPPSYTESQQQHDSLEQPQPANLGSPPPYTPAPPAPPAPAAPASSIIIERTGPGYQRFDVVDEQPHVVSIFHLGPEPCLVICPACGKQVMTVTRPVPGAITWLTACILLFLCILCTFLPFCIPKLQDVAHDCPVCRRELGVYSRL